MLKKVRITKVRTPETMEKYIKFNDDLKTGKVKPKLVNLEDRAVKKFRHWIILENDFPYDAIASVSHMIFTKRKVVFDWDFLSQEEKDELNHLKKTYLKDHYDVLYENLPSGQSITGHFHLHLLVLKFKKF